MAPVALVTVSIPQGYQYVGASLMSTVFVVLGQYIGVSRYRKRAGIEYPQMYAEKAEMEKSPEAFKFNCAQRAHQQTLEVLPLLTLPALISGLKYPIPTAIAVATWSVSRIFFTRGYISGGPKKRGGIMSGLGSLAMVGLILTAAYTSGTWALGGI
ncbi:membrane-associated proteins in eicosanoid and glutathione metabolism [Agrocybe pediades]|nr:membrane-associated proteins in eicosanoid and glutathione metabolism [Agrocybe pediades]